MAGMLGGEINWNMNREITDYVKKHKFKFIDSDNSCIELFTPADKNLFDVARVEFADHGRSIYRNTYSENERCDM